MESLPLFVKGGTFHHIKDVTFATHWIAGDDYGRMVAAALKKKVGLNENIIIQGPEKLTMEEAGRRFIKAYDPSLSMRRIPFWLLKAMGIFSTDAKELVSLFKICDEIKEKSPDPAVWEELSKPSMTIEAYAGYARGTGDFPQK